jgi:hypothetical protein
LEPDRSEATHEPNIIPLDVFEEEDSDNKTDNAAELTWMQFLELAIGQISSEPDELADVDSIPSFRQEEVKIEDVTPDSSVWFPFPSKEVSTWIYTKQKQSPKELTLTFCAPLSILSDLF